jgi:hypothetical protein
MLPHVATRGRTLPHVATLCHTLLAQAVNRGRKAREQVTAKKTEGAATKGEAAQGEGTVAPVTQLDLAMMRLYDLCDETALGVSVSELEQKLSSDGEARGLLDAPGAVGHQKLLHHLEIGRWLESEGRISLAALLRIASPPGGAGGEGESNDVTC